MGDVLCDSLSSGFEIMVPQLPRYVMTLMACAVAFELTSAPIAAEPAFGFSALQKLIDSRSLRSVDAVIAELPPLLRSNYALVFDSRSLQAASFGAPRAILYGTDAQLVVTFNGDPSQAGYDSIETMEFDTSTQTFRFREINFPARGMLNEPVTISEANPTRCQRCHGMPAKPVWDTHPLWPGVYGQRYRASLLPEERTGLAEFLVARTKHPRYRHLLDSERFANDATFRPRANSYYAGTPREPPNVELAALLSELTARSVVAELRRQPSFPLYQYALLGLSAPDCGSLTDFLPMPYHTRAAESLRVLTDRTTRDNQLQAVTKSLRVVGAVPKPGHMPTSYPALEQLRTVALGLGVTSDHWTTALEDDTYDFTQPPTAGNSLRDALLAEVAKSDSKLVELSANATTLDGDRYCEYLRRRSVEILTASMPMWLGTADVSASQLSHSAPADKSVSSLLAICSACHESDVGPRIPFSNSNELRAALPQRTKRGTRLIDELMFRLSDDAGSRRMPLGLHLPQEARATLETYFLDLSRRE